MVSAGRPAVGGSSLRLARDPVTLRRSPHDPPPAIVAFAAAASPFAAGGVSATPERYVLDPTHTFVNLEVLHFGTSTVHARFDRAEGHVLMDPAARTGEAVNRIDTASVSSGIPDFDQHLKSPEFFASGRSAAWGG